MHPTLYAVRTTVCIRYMSMRVNVTRVLSYMSASAVLCVCVRVYWCFICVPMQVTMHAGVPPKQYVYIYDM